MTKIPNWSKIELDDNTTDLNDEVIHAWEHDESGETIVVGRDKDEEPAYTIYLDLDTLFYADTRHDAYYDTVEFMKDNVHRLTGRMANPAHCPECGHLLGKMTNPEPDQVAHCGECGEKFGLEELLEEDLYIYEN